MDRLCRDLKKHLRSQVIDNSFFGCLGGRVCCVCVAFYIVFDFGFDARVSEKIFHNSDY